MQKTTDADVKFAQETLLELVQLEGGKLVLRPVDKDEEPLVSIEFSDKVQDMLGSEVHGIGQYMVQAALQAIMQQQVARWHAQVYDEEPIRYS